MKHINFILRRAKYPKGEPFMFDYPSRGKDGRLKKQTQKHDTNTKQ